MRLINKKNIYILSLFVICLLISIIIPTYAKFASTYTTTSDVAGLGLQFNVDITNVEEYEKFTIPAGTTYKFNIKLNNASATDIIYYGIWYRMIEPSKKTSDILIGKIKGTEVATSGSIEALSDITVSIVIINNSINDITIDIGVGSSITATTDIEYLDGRYLIKGEVEAPRDFMIKSIKIDNVTSTSLPTSGLYDMTYTCSKGSQLEWDTYSKSITYKSGSYIKDSCNLEFTTSTDYKYLNEMPVGSYVAYEGVGGTVGTTSVNCKKNGTASSSTDETEAPNSCLGQNAREDLDTSGYTYGYCGSANYKYYTTGWRIAYIDTNTNKVAIISAGSPECVGRTSSTDNQGYIYTANALALKYCNPNFVDGDSNGNKCTCTGIDSDGDGVYDQCSSISADAWALNDDTFNKMTEQATGVTGGGYLYNSISGATQCIGLHATKVCGYNNDLIDNGGFYWFAVYRTNSNSDVVRWYPNERFVYYSDDTNAYGLRSVISLSSSVYVTGGKGTIDDPYTIKK